MTQRAKSIAAVAASAGTLLVFTAFIFLPLIKGIGVDSVKVFSARQELNQVSLYEEQIRKFEELSQLRERDIAAYNDLFVDRHTPITFIEFLENHSQGSKVSLKITPIELLKREEDVWDSMNFELAGKGLYPYVLSFVKQLESSPYLLEFKNGTLQRLTTGEVDFSLLVKVYVK